MSGMQGVNRRGWWVVALVLTALLASGVAVTAQGPKPHNLSMALGTGFTYQGQLKQNGAPVNGTRSLAFRLYDAPSGGSALGTITQTLPITGGLFTTVLDFGNQFNGDERYLGIAIGPDPELTPRQRLSAVPYASYATGNWGLTGNAGTTFGNYLGTTDAMSLTLGVSGTAALRVYPAATSPNLIGGSQYNTLTLGIAGATIGGGGASLGPNSAAGDFDTIGGGVFNTVSSFAATVSGGGLNTASANDATVGGGSGNTASGANATVGAGSSNTASASNATVSGGQYNAASGPAATVAGGNKNTASVDYATVGGGYTNTASGQYATVAGGNNNTASGNAATVAGGNNIASFDYATVGGGAVNTASGLYATVGGGLFNIASGSLAAVGGGGYNTASGNYSFAAGHNAKANQRGVFVWADSTGWDFNSGGAYHFDVRATGGISLVTGIDISGTPTAGVYVVGGGSGWNAISDRSAKMNFEPVDGRQVLAQLATVPLETWNYKTQDPTIRHLGPMAQDFHAAFNVGEDNVSINSIDAQGVALAAIQGLNQIVQAQQVEIAQLKAEVSASGQTSQASRLAAQPDGLLPALVGLSLLMNVLLGVVLVVHLRHGGRP